MRIRATMAAATVSGALALTALAVPAAQAADSPAAAAAKTATSVNAPADESNGDTAISNLVVNGGKPVVVGTTNKVTFTVSFTVTDDSGVARAQTVLWHGTDFNNDIDGGIVSESDWASCTAVDSTTSNCKESFTVDPQTQLANFLAGGGWKVWAIGQGNDGDYVQKDNAKGFSVQRYSKLTVNASPEPVKKGGTITVTGALTRANWDTHKYAGYTVQPVKLQFRKKDSSTYSTVKTVTSSSTGSLKTTVTASVDGYWRYSFAGTSTTPAVNATGDFVDVQ
ncbi:DUF5707 domain-containing protein [Streptomyces sp. NPDC002004]